VTNRIVDHRNYTTHTGSKDKVHLSF